MANDIERLQSELAEAQKFAALGRLLAGIVHEINTPIGSIFSNTEVLRRSLDALRRELDADSPDVSRVRNLLESCSALLAVDKIACDRIRSLIRGLKSFSRSDETEPVKIDLGQQIQNTLKLVAGDFRGRVTVTTEIGALPEIECYPGKLNQVLLNVIVNAGQAIAREGTVAIRAFEEDGQVCISIRDSGEGIPEAMRGRIFEGGFTTKAYGEGTGLGLNISKRIVEELHGGSLTFESATGRGTTFLIRIPVAQKKTPGVSLG